MKTLDEVIEELEDEGLFADALHYLKEYRMQLDDIVAKRKKLAREIDNYQEAVKNCEEAENKYKMLSGKLDGFPTADIRKMLRY